MGKRKSLHVKKIVLHICLLLILCLAAGCGEKTEEKEVAKGKDKGDTIQIGMSFDSFVIERWERDRDVFVSTAKDNGADVLVQVADGEVEEQIDQIRYFINKNVDAIVIIAVDCNALSDVIGEAKNAGIYVVCYDRLCMDADADLYVSFDNERVGELMGECLNSHVPFNGRVLCINGSETDHNVEQVQAGLRRALSKSSLQIAENEYCPNWDAEVAYDLMQEILDSKLRFDAIMCGNDDIATTVHKALSERGMADDVQIVGQDADLAACQRVVKGWQAMTVYKSVESLAKEAAVQTIALVKDGSVKYKDTTYNNMKMVPSILLEPVGVTKDNMDEVIIEGGFHQHNEVYTD